MGPFARRFAHEWVQMKKATHFGWLSIFPKMFLERRRPRLRLVVQPLRSSAPFAVKRGWFPDHQITRSRAITRFVRHTST
jgi:hypothetical protein